MSATRKLANFRQLSLTCDSPSPHQKRKSLKKQFSEDIPEFKDAWFGQEGEIHISLNAKNKKTTIDRPPSVKIAWSDKTDIKSNNENFAFNEEVIIKKCKEVKRVSSGRLTRHPSLEKDSILNSKQDLAIDRLRIKNQNVIDKENEKTDVKPNLQIFLAHNTQDYNDSCYQTNISDSQTLDNLDSLDHSDQFLEKSQPKYLQPLVTNVGQSKSFQIKKSVNKKSLDSPKAVDTNQKRPNFYRSNTIVVVPLVENNKHSHTSEGMSPIQSEHSNRLETNDEPNGINVIIRPMTAQSRREKFQKRTNSAFQGISKDLPTVNFRPPLVRSSSAPSTKPEKSKFLASKRKLKGTKKSPKGEDRTPNNFEAKEWKNAAQTPSEIVTMVSLISPSGSENEEDSEEDIKERPKSVLKRESSIVEKIVPTTQEDGVHKDVTKNVTLRKTVKSVSFQQSSIHAVRSFSASFPARRGSMATALSLGNGTGNQKPSGTKTQEKRATNPGSPDADERVPKRRLVRSNTEERKSSSVWQRATSQIGLLTKSTKAEDANSTFTIDIQAKSNNNEADPKFLESSLKLNLEENVILIYPDEIKKGNNSTNEEEERQKDEPTYDTPKEKQCWAMYCKMTEKGINVSYDTILRGMLTPTEYRIRRKTSIAEEMNMLVNPQTEDAKPVPSSECLIKTQPNLEIPK